MNSQIMNNYKIWKNHTLTDNDLDIEMDEIADKIDEIEDRFYRDLEFGTGGLRGVIGVGTNRMNIYTVGKATKGLANYMKSRYDNPSIAIAYDSRIKSDVFARVVAEVMAAEGVQVYIWPELMPTPALSYAVRYLKCSGGVVITASHNPAKYNGYKVYGADGCQITTEAAAEILEYIERVDTFEDVKRVDFSTARESGAISYIGDDCFNSFIDSVASQSLCGDGIDKSVRVVYTPLYGTGLKCVTTCLKKQGFTHIELVEEQAHPDGHFPTCPYPNPEIREALELGLQVAKEKGADILIATDPDCDRVGIAVKYGDDYKLLSGNEVGLLLLEYICKRRIALGCMPNRPICVKTIVTMDLASRIAEDYGVETIDVLTGFKFIGEQIGLLESKGEEDRYIFGFEESYGYLTGGYVRDKDAVDGSMMIAEMYAYYKNKGKSLIKVLSEIYKKYGYCLNTLHSYEFDGESGFKKMQAIMDNFRNNPLSAIGRHNVTEIKDYINGIGSLPKSNVIKYMIDGNSSIVLRPSGTEPKLKLYISVNAVDQTAACEYENIIAKEIEMMMI